MMKGVRNNLKTLPDYTNRLVVGALQWVSIAFWIFEGMWWGFALWALLQRAGLFGYVTIINTLNICPECHQEFKPGKKEVFFAKHTPTTRNLTCSEVYY